MLVHISYLVWPLFLFGVILVFLILFAALPAKTVEHDGEGDDDDYSWAGAHQDYLYHSSAAICLLTLDIKLLLLSIILVLISSTSALVIFIDFWAGFARLPFKHKFIALAAGDADWSVQANVTVGHARCTLTHRFLEECARAAST